VALGAAPPCAARAWPSPERSKGSPVAPSHGEGQHRNFAPPLCSCSRVPGWVNQTRPTFWDGSRVSGAPKEQCATGQGVPGQKGSIPQAWERSRHALLWRVVVGRRHGVRTDTQQPPAPREAHLPDTLRHRPSLNNAPPAPRTCRSRSAARRG